VENRLNELRAEVALCNKCSISKTTINKVFGEFHEETFIGVMSIAEAPGEEEDKNNKPFCGKAGRLWEEMLDSIQLHRRELYVCNSVMCRPVQNKLSKDFHEVVNCNNFLKRQIEIVQPKIIITWGKTAFYSIFGWSQDSMKLIRQGNPRLYNNKTVIISTYHPSFINRRMSMAWEAYKDLAMIKEHLHDVDPRKNKD
jgi:DNA polymerase